MPRRLTPLLLVALGPLAAGADPPAAGRPTCALLDPERDPRAALLAAKALAAADAVWVERASVDAVLKEQKLQALFGPQGVGDRVRLGRLLKADLLVSVRPVAGAKEPALELVVSETAGGLRLLVRGVAVTADAAADAAALWAATREGVAKHRERVREVVAVPPFLSRDLGFDTDHLKGALAKLVEQAALARPGVVAVELAEAEALARELALTAPGARPDRPAPLYLLGEYRHEGRDKDRTVALTLRAERAGKVVAPPVVRVVRPAEAPAAVREWAAARLDAAPGPAGDPKAEVGQLVARAHAFGRLGDREEALALAEAVLLLDPDLSDMRATAVRALTPMVREAFLDATRARPGGADRLERLFARGVTHLEPLAASGDLVKYRDRAGLDLLRDFRAAAEIDGPPNRIPGPDGVARFVAIREHERAAYRRLIPVLAARGKGEEVTYVGWLVRDLPQAERFEQLARWAEDLAAHPNARTRTVDLMRGGAVIPPGADTPAFQAVVARLAKSPNPDLRGAAADLTAMVERVRAAPPQVQVPGRTVRDPTAPGPAGVMLRPILLTGAPGVGRPVAPAGLVAAGPGVDVVWARTDLYRMTDKGTLRPVWAGPEKNGGLGFSSVVSDGRFVWATLPRYKEPPALLVVEPASGKVWDLSAAPGLPQAPADALAARHATPALAAAPLEPGRACVCGSVLGRTWVAVVSFDPAAGVGAARVVHEAREAPDRTAAEQWRSAGVSFTPTMMATLRAPPGPDGRAARRVLIGRGGGENLEVKYHPLVIDPDGPGAEVFPDRLLAGPEDVRTASAGAVYLARLQLPTPGYHLARIGFPGTKSEVVATGLPNFDVPNVRVAAHAGRVHVSVARAKYEPIDRGPSTPPSLRYSREDEWWVADADGKSLRRVATGLKPVAWVASSAHYGLVASVGGELQTVEVP